jgi:hypothetical protein
MRTFFETRLGGKVVPLRVEDDVTGDYAKWMTDELDGARVVVWRPDNMVFGAAKELDGAEGLLTELRALLCA